MVALQRDRWILWLPVSMVAGAALWLTAPTDPPWWIGPLFLVLGTATAIAIAAWTSERADGWAMTTRHVLGGLCALIAAAGLGFTSAHLRGLTVAQPAYIGGEEPVRVEGWVVANDANDNGPRLRLLVRSIEGVAEPPRYVRLSVSEAGLLTAGRAASCRGILGPPSGPMAPGAYDFARRAYFERLAATGFAFGRCRPADFAPPPDWLDQQRLLLAAVRADLAAAIVDAAPGRGGAIASALITGDRSAIDADTNAALRDSGLGHLLSVSGIHMGIVGGLVFATLVWTLSLIAPIALRFPIKKIAAVGALLVLAAYLIISGSSVPALRSFVMACVAFGAILLDRPAISMRGLALAAFIVVLIFPESVIEPGFQMSFAATMALVALFEILKRAPHEPALPTPGPLIGALQATTRGIGGVLLISFVAGLATDPFAIYHFQRFSLYALPANLIAAPIMSFLVAPAAAVAAVLAPFGMADIPLEVMASALDLIAAVGQTFGERPEAVRAMPRPPDLAFILCVVSLLWVGLWRGALRWLGVIFFAASIALYIKAPTPMVAFDADTRAVYARADGASAWTLIAAPGRSTYARDRLGAMLGLSPPTLERLAPPENCGEGGCTWLAADRTFAFVTDETGFARACQRDAIVMSRATAPADFTQRCGTAAILDAPDLALRGGALIYATEHGVRIERALSPAISRPWTPRGGASDQE
ncbi:ComEC/Rec2 family competence protein [Terricaulis silvestris]|uniref:ComEC/Rec2 family competence protein n=1 Tax=Terricaulis silvestris TaxID=2686094 RepID=UPI00131E2A66|nr:ComEC/Rec2 family competence protein [Terricaulis silvestris]